MNPKATYRALPIEDQESERHIAGHSESFVRKC